MTYNRFRQITQFSPELVHGVKTHKQNNKEADKFYADCAREWSSSEW